MKKFAFTLCFVMIATSCATQNSITVTYQSNPSAETVDLLEEIIKPRIDAEWTSADGRIIIAYSEEVKELIPELIRRWKTNEEKDTKAYHYLSEYTGLDIQPNNHKDKAYVYFFEIDRMPENFIFSVSLKEYYATYVPVVAGEIWNVKAEEGSYIFNHESIHNILNAKFPKWKRNELRWLDDGLANFLTFKASFYINNDSETAGFDNFDKVFPFDRMLLVSNEKLRDRIMEWEQPRSCSFSPSSYIDWREEKQYRISEGIFWTLTMKYGDGIIRELLQNLHKKAKFGSNDVKTTIEEITGENFKDAVSLTINQREALYEHCMNAYKQNADWAPEWNSILSGIKPEETVRLLLNDLSKEKQADKAYTIVYALLHTESEEIYRKVLETVNRNFTDVEIQEHSGLRWMLNVAESYLIYSESKE